MNLGTLRVFNEYLFQTNPHHFGHNSLRDIELVTLVIDGELIYKNNKGIHETVHAGDLFTVSCGIGVISSVHVPMPVKLIEVWVFPSKYSLKPSFQKLHVDAEECTNTILQIINSEKKSNNVSGFKIHQDANFYMTKLGPEKEIEHYAEPERKMYLFVIAGKVSINNNFDMGQRDAAIITFSSSETIHLKNRALGSTDLILIDLAK
jgi:redox-sensitive bicupin YhaK (pirin superfamily)